MNIDEYHASIRLYNSIRHDEDSIKHHGIKGQKWGVRRYQNEDGSLTVEGRERYGKAIERSKEIERKVDEYTSKANNNLKENLIRGTKAGAVKGAAIGAASGLATTIAGGNVSPAFLAAGILGGAFGGAFSGAVSSLALEEASYLVYNKKMERYAEKAKDLQYKYSKENISSKEMNKLIKSSEKINFKAEQLNKAYETLKGSGGDAIIGTILNSKDINNSKVAARQAKYDYKNAKREIKYNK